MILKANEISKSYKGRKVVNKVSVQVILNEKLKEGNLVPCVYIGVKNNMLLARRL